MSAVGNDPTRAVYVISVAAELAGVHPQTLRNYERGGLLDPTRTAGGSRRFSERDLELEAEIHELREEMIRRLEEHRRAIEDVRRSHRREIVPLNQSPTLFRHVHAQNR